MQGNDDEESTRLQPIEEMQAALGARGARGPGVTAGKDPQSKPLESASVPLIEADAPAGAPQPPPVFGAPPSMPAPMPMTAPVPPDAVPAKESWIARNWRESSGPRKAHTARMVPLVWAVWGIFTDPPPSPHPQKPAASATASASPSTMPSAGAPSTGSTAPTVEPPPVVKTAAPAGSGAPQTTSGAKTPQREVADAVVAGAFERAAKLYADLAKANPSVPAYAEAARIMKANANRR